MNTRLAWVLVVTTLVSLRANAAETVHAQSSIEDQRDLMVTVYNNDYGLVREVRELQLPRGVLELEFRDVAASIDATSVAFRSLSRPDDLAILEQNYRYDLLSPQTLLARFVGRKLHYVRELGEGAGARQEVREGELLSLEDGQVVRFGDVIEINPPGAIRLDEIPADLLSRPTLVWLLNNDYAKAQQVEISYLTTGMGWHADYVAVLGADERSMEITGWVTLENRSGASYRNAALKLIAGDVRKAEEPTQVMAMEAMDRRMYKAAAPFEERAFFEYHLYTLDRRTTLANNETKQIVLLTGQGVGVDKEFSVESSPQFYSAYAATEEQQVDVTLHLVNSEKNHLGMALPAGRVRVYKADRDTSLQLIGEERIAHTPRDETLDLRLGKAFDVVAERRQTEFRRRGDRSSQVGYEVELRNHKDAAVRVKVIEHLPGDWNITQESHPHRQADSTTVEFEVDVPARGVSRVAYSALVSW